MAAFIIVAPKAALPQTTTPDQVLTEEDLRTALEQGDITAAEFADLIESFRSRTAADPQFIDQATDIPDLPDVIPEDDQHERQPPRSVPTPTTVAYQTTIPIRGSAAENHLLSIHPNHGLHSARLEISRTGNHAWQTRTARATLRRRDATVTLGAFDTRWTGGLLIGPAPDFLDRDTTFARTILNPQRGRLHGVMIELPQAMHLTTITSYRRDADLAHTACGATARYRVASIDIQPALLHQSLRARTDSRHFNSDLFGLSLAGAGGFTTWQTDISTDATSIAAQGAFQTSNLDHELDIQAWHIPASFRHPLLSAHTESDRESIAYPELQQTLSSSSTGERGFRAHLRYGPPQLRHAVMLTWWRETVSRTAALRLRVRREHTFQSGSLITQYYMHARPSLLSHDYRHELGAQYNRRRITARLRLRYIDGTWSPFATYSAQLRLTWSSLRHDPSRGRITVSLAYDHYDLRHTDAGYLTTVIVQRLQIEKNATLNFHLRLRTAYRDNPKSINLRIVSGVTL